VSNRTDWRSSLGIPATICSSTRLGLATPGSCADAGALNIVIARTQLTPWPKRILMLLHMGWSSCAGTGQEPTAIGIAQMLCSCGRAREQQHCGPDYQNCIVSHVR